MTLRISKREWVIVTIAGKSKTLVIGCQKQENHPERLSFIFHICLPGRSSAAQCTAAVSHSAPQLPASTAVLFLPGVEWLPLSADGLPNPNIKLALWPCLQGGALIAGEALAIQCQSSYDDINVLLLQRTWIFISWSGEDTLCFY